MAHVPDNGEQIVCWQFRYYPQKRKSILGCQGREISFVASYNRDLKNYGKSVDFFP